MSREKKGHIDLDSVHDKLADKYKIDKDIDSKISTTIKDFKSVSDTITKFEKILDKGQKLAERDEEYNSYLLSIKNDLDEQKFQLFYLKLTSGESNIVNLLLNMHDNSTANDFIVLEREIKKYEKLIQSLESESELSEEYKLLWDEHNNNTANYFDELQTKKIHCSVIASKNRVETAKSEYQNKLNKAADSLVTADVTYTKKSLKKLELVIDEAGLTGKKDEKYSEYLDYQKSKITEHKRDIEDVQLKIDIEKHRKIVEETKPSVKKGLDKLKKESELDKERRAAATDSDEESLYEYINRRAGDDKTEENELWDNIEDKEKDQFDEIPWDDKKDEINIVEQEDKEQKDDSNDIEQEKDDGADNETKIKVGNIIPKHEPAETISPIFKIGLGVILQTSLIIAIIYFSSNNYILLRGLKYQLPIKEKKLALITSNAIGEKLIKTKAFDEHFSKKGIIITKLLSSVIPDAANINRLVINQSKNNGPFTLSLYGKIGIAGSSGRRILTKMLRDLKNQRLIKDALLINQQPGKENRLLFTIDITI
jgi:hypothetical protein